MEPRILAKDSFSIAKKDIATTTSLGASAVPPKINQLCRKAEGVASGTSVSSKDVQAGSLRVY